MTFFKEREIMGSTQRDSIQSDESKKSVSSHLSVKKVTFFKKREITESTQRDSIQPDGRKKSDEDGQCSS